MLVASHKREVDGPAPIPCDKWIVQDLEVFVTKLRPLVCGHSSNSRKHFLKSDGTPYQRGTIGHRITAFVLITGVRADRPSKRHGLQEVARDGNADEEAGRRSHQRGSAPEAHVPE